MRLVLASKSPRRIQLLSDMGLQFVIAPASIDESHYEARTPLELALRVATAKAQCIAADYPDSIVLAADTVVDIDGISLGKPTTDREATRMLKTLSGRSHSVHTGFVLIGSNRTCSDVVSAKVWFRELRDIEIEYYVNSGEPFDKAGGYGIQGFAATMVERIEGDFYTVMGLPICRLSQMLHVEFGVDIHEAIQKSLLDA